MKTTDTFATPFQFKVPFLLHLKTGNKKSPHLFRDYEGEQLRFFILISIQLSTQFSYSDVNP